MNDIMKVIFSLSVSGSLLILALLLCKPLLKNRVSRTWQYYIWMVVIARLLLPFAPEENLMGTLSWQADRAAEQIAELAGSEKIPGHISSALTLPDISGSDASGPDNSSQRPDGRTTVSADTSQRGGEAVLSFLWLVWLGPALILLIRRITVYQSFAGYIRAGWEEVSDTELLDGLSRVKEEMGIRRPVELYRNPLIGSPLLLGLFHPCIVLPCADTEYTDFEYIARHELLHFKRRDMLYKWLVQITVCFHWFNPLVWLMSRETDRACELACDEGVMKGLNEAERRAYGDVLLNAVGAGGSYTGRMSVTLGESAEVLKERLGAVMNFKKGSKGTKILSLVLATIFAVGAMAAGAYAAPAGRDAKPSDEQMEEIPPAQSRNRESYSARAEKYYEAGSLPLFEMTFPYLGEEEQNAWLERIYSDDAVTFFSVAVSGLAEDDPFIEVFAEKAYADSKIAFFSVLTDCMSDETLEKWLDRALKDDEFSFQTVLFHALDMEGELEEKERELDRQYLEACEAVGITRDGKLYYYQGQLVNIFLDRQPNNAFYTLNMNPQGTVNVKVIRDKDGKITGAEYMTEEEVEELFLNQ